MLIMVFIVGSDKNFVLTENICCTSVELLNDGIAANFVSLSLSQRRMSMNRCSLAVICSLVDVIVVTASMHNMMTITSKNR